MKPASPRRPRPRLGAAFMTLWVGESLSSLGTQLTAFALGLWALQLSDRVSWYAAFALAGLAPKLLLAPFAGVLVDRFDRRRLLLVGHLGAGCCGLALAFAFAFATPSLWHVLGLVALGSALAAANYPAFQAATASLVESAALPRANALVHVSNATALVLAPMCAALMLVHTGVGGVLLLDVLSFAAAVGALSLITIPTPVGKAEAESEHTMAAALRGGLRYLLARPELLALIAVFAALNFCLGSAQLLLAPLVLAHATELAVGQVMSEAGLGMLLGGLFMVAWGGPKRLIVLIALASALQAVALLFTALGSTPAFIGLGAMAVFFWRPVQAACSATLWQREVPARLHGRVFALRSLVVQGALPLAHALSGPASDALFEPAMAHGADGLLARTFGPWLGLGPGRGVAALLICVAALIALVALATRLSPRLWRLETPL